MSFRPSNAPLVDRELPVKREGAEADVSVQNDDRTYHGLCNHLSDRGLIFLGIERAYCNIHVVFHHLADKTRC